MRYLSLPTGYAPLHRTLGIILRANSQSRAIMELSSGGKARLILALFQDNADAGRPIWASLHLGDYISIAIGVVGFVVGTVFAVIQYFAALKADKRADEAEEKQKESDQKLDDVVRQQSIDMESSESRHKAQMDELKKQAAELTELALNKAVAKFPDNVDALTEFILGTKNELYIMADSLGYALYSKPSRFEYYIKAIEKVANEGRDVRLLLYSLDTLRTALARQIPPGKPWEDVERKSERCKEFFKTLEREIPESYEEFRDILLTKEQELMTRVAKVKMKVVNRPFSAFCWIRDGATAAMFAFRNDGLGEGGLTFRTIDVGMAGDFKAVFDSEWEGGAKPIYRDRW